MSTRSLLDRLLRCALVATFAAPLAAQTALHVDASAAPGGDGTSWATAFTDLGDALDLAALDPLVATVRVAEGAYRPDRGTLDPTQSFVLVDGVALLGGYPTGGGRDAARDPAAHPTVLTGDLLGDDGPPDPVTGIVAGSSENSRHVVRGVGLSADTVLDGFTVRSGVSWGLADDAGAAAWLDGGAPVLRRCTFERSWAGKGGGLGLTDCAAVVTSCTFRENRADDVGGGAAVLGPVAATFTDCTFEDNLGGLGAGLGLAPTAILSGPGNDSLVERCTFTANHGSVSATAGGGLYARHGAPVVRACTFTANSSAGGGGMFVDEGTATVERCLFVDNRQGGDGGGALSVTDFSNPDPVGTTEVVSCAMVGNTGGVLVVQTHVRLVQCTIAGNVEPGAPVFLQWPAVFGQLGEIDVENCIVWGNADLGFSDDERDHLAGNVVLQPVYTVTSSTVQDWAGVLPGSGDGTAPRFVGPRGPDGDPLTAGDNDYRLAPGSPAVDVGLPDVLPGSAVLDLDGLRRVRDGDGDGEAVVDRGAWERGPFEGEVLTQP